MNEFDIERDVTNRSVHEKTGDDDAAHVQAT